MIHVKKVDFMHLFSAFRSSLIIPTVHIIKMIVQIDLKNS